MAAFLMVLLAVMWGTEEQLQGETTDYYPATLVEELDR